MAVVSRRPWVDNVRRMMRGWSASGPSTTVTATIHQPGPFTESRMRGERVHVRLICRRVSRPLRPRIRWTPRIVLDFPSDPTMNVPGCSRSKSRHDGPGASRQARSSGREGDRSRPVDVSRRDACAGARGPRRSRGGSLHRGVARPATSCSDRRRMAPTSRLRSGSRPFSRNAGRYAGETMRSQTWA